MKQIIAILGIGVFAVSCNTSDIREKNAALQAQQNTIDSMKIEIAKQQVIDSMNEVVRFNTLMSMQPQEEIVTIAPKPKKKKVYQYASNSERVVAQPVNTVNDNTQNTQPVSQTPPIVYQEPVPEPQKKGWSSKAKGAVIGGVAGAAAGAVIHKRQRAVGAVVGSVLGAGAGLGIGAVIDKKNGR